LPLGERPILSYTLECLKISGVQEAYVYCTSFAQDIKDYLKFWTEQQGSCSMNIVPITNEECRSLGDAMRDLDAKGLLRQHFILVSGDTIGNVNLGPVLEEHK
jgi:translation initiation factor eIF-2B subunit epsilon